MAQQTLTFRSSAALLSLAILAVALVALLHPLLEPVDESMTNLQFLLRGEEQADTSIVLVYIDDQAVADLGWPIKRNFSALMVNALTELRVKAIGMELLFDRETAEYVDYPEYDALLTAMVRASRRTVLTCYADSLAMSGGGATILDSLPEFRFPGVAEPATHGTGVHLPFPRLRSAAAGTGHVNFTENQRIPVFLGNGESVIPAFPLEILRVATGTERAAVHADAGSVSMRMRGDRVTVHPSSDGTVELRYPGTVRRSFAAYPFVEVLKSYDALRNDAEGSVPVRAFHDKIVLVGIIGEGRSQTFRTPFDPRYPALAMHATFLDNALRSGFLTSTGTTARWLISLAGALFCGAGVLFLPKGARRWIVVGMVAAYLILSLVCFRFAGLVIPVADPVIAVLLTTVGVVMYRHRVVQAAYDALSREKDGIVAQLRDKEARLAMLERELVNAETPASADRTVELMEEIRRYKAEIRTLSSQADDMEPYTSGPDAAAEFEGIMHSAGGRMKPVIDFVKKIADSDAPVLILGESGTGKELIARAIHRRSPRAAGPFIAVNCGALAESLLESELFGHEKGAFTGAVKDRLGRFEMAEGGTIFLDEIGEVSDAFQLKLLRVLQEGELERVGGTKTIKLNVRIVAATNKELKDMVRQKRFREDLYYRLNVLTIALPPLRERQDDIRLLVGYFLQREAPGAGVSRNVMEALQGYGWPGNVRELESVMRRGALMARAEKRSLISIGDLPDEVASSIKGKLPVHEQILDAIREKGFSRSSVSETAAELGGLNRGTVAEYLRGECLLAFVEHQYDLERAIRHISLSTDGEVNERVRRKFIDYLESIAGGVDRSRPWDDVRAALKPKTKNLPQRYHESLEQTAEAHFRGLWRLPDAGA